ncbi:Mss4-like protein [Podospora didyma]|uniref:Mss4-like protein n=1 Tax=Podospora didyma TaxID=330526 RepID=A0AAE0K6N8_9PEZI|nr:Mss4-like protein [Podospora didyma]
MLSTTMAIQLQGRCVCNKLQYSLSLTSLDDARTTLCHCHSCRRAFGANFGLTAKVLIQMFCYDSGTAKKHTQENGVTREFCDTCGAFICEYGKDAADKFRYVMWGTLDEPEKLAPKGEFFCKHRTEWMPELHGVFHKQELKE